ncbi:uncharacterized protein LMH87_008390 [Akanthomyces muscarius]|uniref:DUF7702 domain-containing protein n=1 Tax=Akanthomyces muscarius TaxID=2231603 RepID=A0A9W8QLK3_AKAMU|nr:uncharacterized protein LMH87_008390 [Akanthomyces muscarius]KAJ4159490.1 hypothetical protein LMH87_008390 [Akanthomyces muscarius]
MALDSLSIAKLVIYMILAPGATYCLWKHGRRGFLAWFYVQVFCVLRIASGGISLHTSDNQLTSTVVNSIGLSPLMLACAGILHEVVHTCIPDANRLLELTLDINYHGIVALGMVLTIVAVVKLESGADGSFDTMLSLLKAGAGISALAFALLVIWAILTFRRVKNLRSSRKGPQTRPGMILLYGALIVLPFIALRLAYGMAFLLLRVNRPSSAFIRSLAAMTVLEVVPELIITITYLTVGFLSRDIQQQTRIMTREEGTSMVTNVSDKQ